MSWLITFLVCERAPHLGLIAPINDRSSHFKPTPTGGGLGIVLASTVTGVWLFCFYDLIDLTDLAEVASSTRPMPITILGLSLLLAGAGLWDDIQHLAARTRASAQIFVCLGLLIVIGTLPPIAIRIDAVSFGLLAKPLSISGLALSCLLLIAGVWWINLFNFMDGIDGIAGMQALFILAAGGGLSAWAHPEALSSLLWLWGAGIIGATLAFTVFNWPPASIFMGDVGSTWLAFIIFALALLSIQAGWSTYGMWMILGATFIADATVTLCTRVLRRERWYTAHRSHAYQQLARRWDSHRSVTLLNFAINVFCLLPLAFAYLIWPQWYLVFLGCAYIPLIVGAIKLGAGKSN